MESHLTHLSHISNSNLDRTRMANTDKKLTGLLSVIDESNFDRNFLQSQNLYKEKEKNIVLEDSLDQFRPFSAVVTDNFDFSIKENTVDYKKNLNRKNTFKKNTNDNSQLEGGNVYNPINDLNNNDDSFLNQRNKNQKYILIDTPE